MASPQVEDGYTRIANELYDTINSGDFNRRELKLIHGVIRATYGWNQKMTKSSKLELFRRVGLHPPHGYTALRDLLNRQVLVQNEEGLGIQKDFDQWQPRTSTKTVLVPKRYYNQSGTTRGTKSVLATSTKTVLPNPRKRPSGVASRGPKDNKDILKDNIADAPPASASRGEKKGPKIHPETDHCIRLFSEEFSRKFERGYQVMWSQDRKMISGLLRGQGAEVVQEQIGNFFRCPPRWVRENGKYTIPVFLKTFNELQALKGQGDL